MKVRRGRAPAALVGMAALSLLLSACGSDGDSGADGEAATGSSDVIDCSVYEQFGDLSGTSVTTYSVITAPESEGYENAWGPFEDCTGVEVRSEWSKEFEAQILVRLQAGSPPDVALFPQPGLLATAVRQTGSVLPVFEETEAIVDETFSEDWKAYGTVDGSYYGFPSSSNSKSFVWYSPTRFAEAGYQVPETWEELIALSDQIAADNTEGLTKPWCAGIGSGDATGWVITDWVEDVMLRVNGTDVYDDWVDHTIPFNDPAVEAAWDRAGEILKNETYVNGGLGDPVTVASSQVEDSAAPLVDGTCFLHKQASFFPVWLPEGTTVAEDGDIFAFYFPADEAAEDKPVLVGSDFVAAFEDRPEVRAFTTYLATADFANVRASEGFGFVSANLGLDVENVDSEIGKLVVQQFQDEAATIRFDGSDLMPGEVGAGTFWSQGTAWIAEDKATTEVLDTIENSWP